MIRLQVPRHRIAAISICCITLCIIGASCASVFVANLQRTAEKETSVFTTQLPSREYIEWKYIQVHGSVWNRPEHLLKRLAERAQQEGADAVINVKYDFQWTWPIVSGTAIKYVDNLIHNEAKTGSDVRRTRSEKIKKR